jgi:hypothetical protein
MQAFSVMSFLFCIICMFTITMSWIDLSYIIFALSLVSFGISLILSLIEIFLSMRALEVLLSDMEDLPDASFFKGILKR